MTTMCGGGVFPTSFYVVFSSFSLGNSKNSSLNLREISEIVALQV